MNNPPGGPHNPYPTGGPQPPGGPDAPGGNNPFGPLPGAGGPQPPGGQHAQPPGYPGGPGPGPGYPGPYGPPGQGPGGPYGGAPPQPGAYGAPGHHAHPGHHQQPHHVGPPPPGQLPPGFVAAGHQAPKKKGKSPWLIIGIVLFSSCVVCGGFGAYLNAQDEKQRATPKEKVSAGEVIEVYTDNELAGDERWKDEWVQINGYVHAIGSDLFDEPYVSISSGGFTFTNVQCSFEDEHQDELHDLSTGDPITVVGKVDGMILNVMVKKCEVVEGD